MTEVAQTATSSSTTTDALDIKLQAFYAKRRANAATQQSVAPVIQKAMSRDRPILTVMVENVSSGKGKTDGEPYCTLDVVVQGATANYTESVKIKNFYKTHVGTVDVAAGTMTLHTNEPQNFKPSLDYWAARGIAVKEQSPIVESLVVKNDMQMKFKVDKAMIPVAEALEPFSIINIGISYTAYCTTEEQAGKKASPEPIKGTSMMIKQIEQIEAANAPKVIDYIISRGKCAVPVKTARDLKISENYDHVVIADKAKQKVRSQEKFFIPLNYDPAELFGRGKALIVTLSTRADGEKSPFTYAEKDNISILHKKAELFLTLEEVDPMNENWNGAKHVVSVVAFESMFKFARISSVQRWKEIAPTIFSRMRMMIVGGVNLYTTFDNPRTKDNFRDDTWYDNYLDLMPQQIVIDYPAEVARIGIPVSRRWVEARLAANAIKLGDHVNQLSGSDKSLLNLTECDGAIALEYLKRPSSSGYEFFVITDTAPTDGHIEMYENVRAYMKQNPGALGLEMLLWGQFSNKNIPLWLAMMFTGDLPEIRPDHRCNGQPPLVFKSCVVYAVNVEEVAKRQTDAKLRPIRIQGPKPTLAITNGPLQSPTKQGEEKQAEEKHVGDKRSNEETQEKHVGDNDNNDDDGNGTDEDSNLNQDDGDDDDDGDSKRRKTE